MLFGGQRVEQAVERAKMFSPVHGVSGFVSLGWVAFLESVRQVAANMAVARIPAFFN